MQAWERFKDLLLSCPTMALKIGGQSISFIMGTPPKQRNRWRQHGKENLWIKTKDKAEEHFEWLAEYALE